MHEIRKKNLHLRRRVGRSKGVIRRLSEELGVSYTHMYRVLNGTRTAPELLQSAQDWAVRNSIALPAARKLA